MDSGDLIHCKELVDQHLRSLEFSLPTNAVYIVESAHMQERGSLERQSSVGQQPEELQRLPQARRGQSSSKWNDNDDYFDGLGRLYALEGAGPGEGVEPGEQVAALQADVSPCPPLHPADH